MKITRTSFWPVLLLAEALRHEPRLDPRIKRAFAVEDGTVDGWQMTWEAIRSAQAYGAQIRLYASPMARRERSEAHIVPVIVRGGEGACASNAGSS